MHIVYCVLSLTGFFAVLGSRDAIAIAMKSKLVIPNMGTIMPFVAENSKSACETGRRRRSCCALCRSKSKCGTSSLRPVCAPPIPNPPTLPTPWGELAGLVVLAQPPFLKNEGGGPWNCVRRLLSPLAGLPPAGPHAR